MSYDLYMLTPPEDGDPMDHLEGLEVAPPRGDPDDDARTRRLADALQAADGRYDEHEFEFEGRGAIELTADGGIQITLSGDHASLNFPYSDSLDARRITDDVDTAVRISVPTRGGGCTTRSWSGGSIPSPTPARSTACSTTGAKG